MKRGEKSPQDRGRIEPRSLSNRSRITNALGLLPSVDGRSTWARRMHDLIYAHTSDLGGEDTLSQAELSLIRRAATITVELEHMEMKFALAEDGATSDQIKTYQMATNTLRRTLEALGLERRAKLIEGPTLGQILREGIRHDREAKRLEAKAT